jgi:endonuclease III
MSARRPAIGYASIVVEQQPYGLLVTVTLSADLTDRGSDRIVRFTSVAEAVDTVSAFLTGLTSEEPAGDNR